MQKKEGQNAYNHEFRVQSSVKYATYQNIFMNKCVFLSKKAIRQQNHSIFYKTKAVCKCFSEFSRIIARTDVDKM